MKRFSCGDVVAGCTATFRGTTDDDILAQVAAHARDGHQLTPVGQAVVDAVKAHIHDASDVG